MADFLDLLDPDLQAAYRRSALQYQQANLPDFGPTGLSQDEESSWLGRRLDESLGGLSYLGKLADKTFGGRAVRSGLNMLAGGDTPTSELLSMLPFSDTLGLTKESNVVQGTDLLSNLGLTTKGDDSWQNQAAGFGAELLTDPSTYLGIGPLTKTGLAASRGLEGAGKLAPTLSGRIAAGHANLLDVGVPLGKMFGLERTGFNPFGADVSASIARNFTKPVTAPATAIGQGLEKYVGGPIDKLLGVNPFTAIADAGRGAGRQFRALFHQPVQGATSAAGQDVAENALTPTFNRLAADSTRAAADAAYDVRQIAQGDPAKERLAEQFLTRSVETPNLEEQYAKLQQHQAFFENQPLTNQEVVRTVEQAMNAPGGTDAERLANVNAALDKTALKQDYVDKNMDTMRLIAAETQREAERAGPDAVKWQSVFTPEDLQVLGQHADRLGEFNRQWLNAERSGGANTPDLLDIANNYMYAQKGILPKQPGEKIIPYFNRISTEFNARKDFMKQRLDEFRNIPGGRDRINDLIKDPYLSGPNRTAPSDLAAEARLVEVLSGQPLTAFTADHPVVQQAKKLADVLKGMEPVYAAQGRDFFDLDFAGRLKQRGEASAKVQAGQQAVYYGIGKYAQPKEAFQAAGQQAMAVPDLLNELKLTRQTNPEAFPDSWGLAHEAVKGRLGLQNVADVANLAVPADLARDILRFGRAWTSPEELRPVMQAWSMMSNLFKTGVTALFPAFHSRNLMSALFNQWRDDALSYRGLKSGQRLARGGFLDDAVAAKLFPGLSAENATHEIMKELIGTDTAFTAAGRRGGEATGALAESKAFNPPVMTGTAEPVKDITSRWLGGLLPSDSKLSTIRKEYSPFGVKGVGGTEDTNVLIQRAREVQRSIEDVVRSGHYVELRLQGAPVEEAAARVKKYHNDYSPSSFTGFENKWMKSLVPWYSFSRKNLPPILEDLASNPGKITGALRLTSGVRDPSEFVPAFIGEGASIPVSGGPEGQQRYVSSFGLPIEDELLKTIGSASRLDVQRTLQQGIGMMNPLVKMPFEQAFGTQLFSGRKLQDLQPSPFASLGGLVPDDIARSITEVAANSPLSRTMKTAEGFIDDRKGTFPTALNLLTGLHLSDVDTAKQQDIAARELVKTALRGSKEARVREEVYVPVNLRGDLDPNERFLLSLLKSTNQRVTDAQAAEKEKKAAGR